MCVHPRTHLHQSSVVGATEIDGTYREILQRFEELLVELKFRQEQQRIEEEEVEKLRKIREEQVRENVISVLLLGCPDACAAALHGES